MAAIHILGKIPRYDSKTSLVLAAKMCNYSLPESHFSRGVKR